MSKSCCLRHLASSSTLQRGNGARKCWYTMRIVWSLVALFSFASVMMYLENKRGERGDTEARREEAGGKRSEVRLERRKEKEEEEKVSMSCQRVACGAHPIRST